MRPTGRMTRSALVALVLTCAAVDAWAQRPARTKPKPAATAAAKTVAGSDPVQAMLEQKSLQGAYNPVLLDFLTEEGRQRLSPDQHREALAQLAAGFKEQIDIKPGAQAAAGIATALGELVGGTIGEGIALGASQVWTEWVDAAFILRKAGYVEEANAFFESCLESFPYESLRSRCASGLALGEPDRAFAVLMRLLSSDYPTEVNNMALRLLGDVAATEGIAPDKKDAAIAAIAKKSGGILNASHEEAAVDGLARSRDPRVVETLRKMSKGMRGDEVKRAALRALFLVFKDAAASEALHKKLKGGDEDRFFATSVLIEAGEAAGFEAALKELTKKKKGGLLGGLTSSDADRDYSADLVVALVEHGGEKARAVLAQAIPARKPDEWITAYMAIGALGLGDTSTIEVVRKALVKEDWPFTRLHAAEALARSGDHSGIAVLQTMLGGKSALKKIRDRAFGKREADPEQLRAAIAESLGRIDHAEGVAILLTLLDDRSASVRLSAAYALGAMKNPAALEGMAKALAVDYGKDEGRPRNPGVHAHLLRAAAAHFPADPRTRPLLTKGSQSGHASVKFLALVAMKG